MSLIAILISLFSIYIQSFWHKEGLDVFTTGFTLDKNKVHVELVISNLGNRDEVIYKAFIGVEKTKGVKDTDETDNLIIIRPGESKKLTVTSPKIEFNETQHINLYIKLLSDNNLNKLELAYYDTELGKLKYRLPKLEIHGITSAICSSCGNIKYDNEYNVERN